MGRKGTYKKFVFYGAVVVSLIIIVYFSLNGKQKDINTGLSLNNPTPPVSSTGDSTGVPAETTGSSNTQQNNGSSSAQPTISDSIDNQNNQDNKINQNNQSNIGEQKAEITPTLKPDLQPTTVKKAPANKPAPKPTPVRAGSPSKNSPVKPSATPVSGTGNEQPKAQPTAKPDNTAVKILKSEVTTSVKFYRYSLDGLAMEVIAVKATDGSIRTALNTCQVCYDSGKGYYEQSGEYLVCQNCGNRFHIDQIGNTKGGCNPLPILQDDKEDDGTYIYISKEFMEANKHYFERWNKQ